MNFFKQVIKYILKKCNIYERVYYIMYKLKIFDLPYIVEIKGKYPNIKYKMVYNKGQSRNESMVFFMKKMFALYHNEFIDKEIDICICTSDRADEAEFFRRVLGKEHIYAFSTMKGYDKVIAIPDFVFHCWKECGIDNYSYMIKECQLFGRKKYTDTRCFWIGNADNHFTRKILIKKSLLNKKYILAEDMKWLSSEKGKKQKSSKYVSIFDHAKYKYLIDIQGFGWSARLKLLFWLNRVVIIAKRPHEEFYFPFLKDGENCIIVKEDLSDLVEKIIWVENTPNVYENIRNGGREFAKKYLTEEYALKYLKTILKKYN